MAGLLWAGFTAKDLEKYKGEGIKPETLLLAHSVAASGFSGTKVLLGNALKTGKLGPMKDALAARWTAAGSNPVLRWAGTKLGSYNPPIRSLSAPGSWFPGQLGNMASRSRRYQPVANVPLSSGFLSDRWGGGWDMLRL
ncbi:hypothetical protein [Streptomyces coelicoflavus]|uniref:hypothetical protein n=1 Tax=Streptomyces coelicoflavus TaxID=285562 RepID=UPI001EF2799F|nr:hypothetical protein [Streptomyces coelicoflavus]